MNGFNLSEWALRAPLARHLLHAHRRRSPGIACLLQPRPQRGSGLHHQDHGRAGRLAGRHARRHAAAGHRAPRAQAAGDAEPRLPAQLHQRRARRRSSSTCKDSTPAGRGAGHLVPGAQEHRRHPPHAAAGRRRARSSTTSSATPSASSTASPPTASPTASCATTSRTSARGCCSVPDVSKIEILGAQDEQIFVEFSTEQLAGPRASTAPALIAALQAQNAVAPAGVGADRRREDPRCGSPAPSAPSRTSWTSTSSSNGRMIRLGDIAHGHARLRRPAAADVPRQRPAGIGLAIAMRDGGDILALGRNVEHAMARDHRRPAGRHRAARWSPTSR